VETAISPSSGTEGQPSPCLGAVAIGWQLDRTAPPHTHTRARAHSYHAVINNY
jgi:hypothetical protein